MTPFASFRAARHFGSLDALRALAIVAVIWRHRPPVSEGAAPFVDIGASGVALFFVLSGFLITTLLLREQSATGTISLRDFYVRRALRIFPLFYAVLALYTALVLLMEHNAAGRLFLHNIPYFATYTNNWFVDLVVNEDGQRRVIFVFAWSLATEKQFYLVWPSLLRYASRRAAVCALIAVALLSTGLRFWPGRMEVPADATQRLVKILQSPSVEICMGVLVAVALDNETWFRRLWSVLGRGWSAPAAAAVAAAVVLLPTTATPQWYLAQGFAFALLIATCVIREDHGLARGLRLRGLARIGVVSYGMYMLHMLAVHVVEAAFRQVGVDSAPATFCASVLTTYAAAEASFRLFESRFLAMKARFQRSDSGTPSVAAAPARAELVR